MPEASGLYSTSILGSAAYADEGRVYMAARAEATEATQLGSGMGLGSIEAFIVATLQRVKQKDRQLATHVSVMRDRQDVTARLQGTVEQLYRLQGAGHGGNGEKLGSEEMLDADLLRDVTQPDGTTRKETVAEFAARFSTEHGITLDVEGGAIMMDSIADALQAVNTRVQRLSSSTELDMTHLQGILESRSMDLKLVSQVMNGERETIRGILGNIG